MKNVIVVLSILPFCLFGQLPNFEFSAKNDNYNGKIKSVKQYTRWLEEDEFYKIDSVLRFNGELQYEALYNEKGFKIFSRGYSANVRANRLVTYNYDASDRIISKAMKGAFDKYRNIITFEYDQIENQILEIDSLGSYSSIGGRNQIINKKLHHQDSIGRIILTEYLDQSDATIMHTKYSYNKNSKITNIDFYEFGSFVSRTESIYDDNKKLSFRIFNSKNILTEEGIFDWEGNQIREYERRNTEGKITFESKEIYFFDEKGNKIKDFTLNLSTGRRLEVEWEIEYY